MLTTLALIFPFPLLITSLTLPSSHLHKRSEAGPVLPSNFPDPCLVNVFGTWYAFATTSDNVNIPIATAPWNGFQGKWELVTDANGNAVDAFPNVPAWVNMTGSVLLSFNDSKYLVRSRKLAKAMANVYRNFN